ncbi:hypothetical protein GCM10022393_34820 [Aquimarina addita]|uniref:Uncharacterized protein n=1 Tax=Aquimarina addita TaxID=870485 RepID=A0ABP6USP1_9FLAO
MKQILTLILLSFLTFSVTAQSVKVKKGVILIDKIEVGTIEKIKVKGPNYYQINDTKGEPIFKIQELAQQSLLFLMDKEYRYRAFYGGKLSDTLTITKKNYWLSEKRIVEYAAQIGILNTKGFDSAKAEELITSTPKRPDWILKKLEEEKKLLPHRGYKVERDYGIEDIYVVSVSNGQGISQLNGGSVTKEKFKIYQGDSNGDHVLIGHGIYEKGGTEGTYLFVFNSKNVPLASYAGAHFQIYEPKSTISPLEHEVSTLSSASIPKSMTNMAKELVKRDLL